MGVKPLIRCLFTSFLTLYLSAWSGLFSKSPLLLERTTTPWASNLLNETSYNNPNLFTNTTNINKRAAVICLLRGFSQLSATNFPLQYFAGELLLHPRLCAAQDNRDSFKDMQMSRSTVFPQPRVIICAATTFLQLWSQRLDWTWLRNQGTSLVNQKGATATSIPCFSVCWL